MHYLTVETEGDIDPPSGSPITKMNRSKEKNKPSGMQYQEVSSSTVDQPLEVDQGW